MTAMSTARCPRIPFLSRPGILFTLFFLFGMERAMLPQGRPHVVPTTTTSLVLSASTVKSGSPVTFTATVIAPGSLVSSGQVTFCDATATYCEGPAVLGTAQLTGNGTAPIKLILSIGTHSIKAVFAGTGGVTGSSSAAQTLTVTGLYPTTTMISASGNTGNYTLTATVVGNGDRATGPTGSVSFLDASNNNAILGTGILGASTLAQSFAAPTTYSTGLTSISVAVDDFNGDGIPDLAVANHGNNTVSVLLGKGDGSFLPQIVCPTGILPYAVVAGDFNSDGIPDLAVPNAADNTVSILLGKGDGSFEGQVTYSTETDPSSVAVGDFNGDGKLDLAVSNYGDNTVSVLLGNGGGSFQRQVIYTIGNEPYSVAVGDFNSDGKPDLAISNGGGDASVSVLLDQLTQTAVATLSNVSVTGAGTHNVDASYPGNTSYAASVSSAVAVTGTETTQTALTLSASTVESGSPVTLTATVISGSTPISPGLVTFCDATAASCKGTAVLGTAQLTANGTATIKLVLSIGTHSIKAVFAGTSTVLSSSSAAQTLTVSGLLYPTTTTFATSGNPGNYTLTATVAGNGNRAAGPTGSVSFLDTSNKNAVLATATLEPSTATQSFAAQTAYATGTLPSSVAVGDLNGDGIPDMAVTNESDNNVSVLLGNGDGTFQQPKNYPTGAGPFSVAIGDFNGDGIPDLAVANLNFNTVAVLLGKGDGTFQFAQNFATGKQPISVAVGDFNGDGIADLAVANYQDNTLSVLLGKGDGTFRIPIGVNAGEAPTSIAVGDFNGDGKQDLAVTNNRDNTVSVELGNGDGSFQLRTNYFTGNGPISVAIGDFNGDGKLDLAVANYNDNTESVLLGKGDGSFQSQVAYVAGHNPDSVALGDFNGDGKLDMAVTNFADNTVYVLPGNGDGTFQQPKSYSTGSAPNAVAIGDFNGDGEPDLAVTNSHGGSVSVLLDQMTQTNTATLSNFAIAGYGIHKVDASYPGTTSYGASVSSTVALTGETVQGTLTMLTSSASSVASGSPVTLTADVIVAGAPVFPGQVNFCDATAATCTGSALLGTAQLTSNGKASIQLTLGIGTHSIKAVFAGTVIFLGSSSLPASVTVTGPHPSTAPLAFSPAIR